MGSCLPGGFQRFGLRDSTGDVHGDGVVEDEHESETEDEQYGPYRPDHETFQEYDLRVNLPLPGEAWPTFPLSFFCSNLDSDH